MYSLFGSPHFLWYLRSIPISQYCHMCPRAHSYPSSCILPVATLPMSNSLRSTILYQGSVLVSALTLHHWAYSSSHPRGLGTLWSDGSHLPASANHWQVSQVFAETLAPPGWQLSDLASPGCFPVGSFRSQNWSQARGGNRLQHLPRTV